MRQWVLDLPKRQRPGPQTHVALTTRMPRIFMTSIQRELRRSAASTGAFPPQDTSQGQSRAWS
jgi:hypothetical protein